MVYHIKDNVIFNEDDIFVLDNDMLNQLYRLARASSLKRSRIVVHKDINDKTHEMIILLMKNSKFKPHRHPKNKSESYHLMSGVMKVNIFDDKGKVIRTIKLVDSGNKYFRNSNGAWHQPIPLTEYVLYHETYTGPFNKEKDVEECKW